MEQQLINRTYVQQIFDPRLLGISKECAEVYNKAKTIFWQHLEQGKWLNSFKLQKELSGTIERINLSGHAYIASIQQFSKATASWKEAKKEYNKFPQKFSGEPKPPIKDKTICPIYFKEETIRFKNGYLLLSLKKGVKPISFRWNNKLGKPIYASISWRRERGWFVSLVLEQMTQQAKLDSNKLLAIDLGIKRTATTFDGKETTTYSGKLIMGLTRLRNKTLGKLQAKLSKLQKHSRRYKRLKKAWRRVSTRIDNQIQDILHKQSRTIVNQCKKNKVGVIVCGDCSSIHDHTNLGKENNQIVQQNPEQRLRKYIEDKFEVIGGRVETIPEHYTSKACPKCNSLNEPKNRNYKCKTCNFQYDRDGVGSVNIYCNYMLSHNVCETLQNVCKAPQNVSFNKMNVVGLLTRPIGWKYKTNQDCLVC